MIKLFPGRASIVGALLIFSSSPVVAKRAGDDRNTYPAIRFAHRHLGLQRSPREGSDLLRIEVTFRRHIGSWTHLPWDGRDCIVPADRQH